MRRLEKTKERTASLGMDWLSELRYPSARTVRLLTTVSAILFIFLVAVFLVTGFVLVRILYPDSTGPVVDPTTLLGNPSLVSVSGPGIATREGVFFPGQRGAPTIILAHGYLSNKSDLLTLAIALQENKYNVFLFDFSGHAGVSGTVTFGYRETRELLAALEAVAQRDDVDPERFGVFGVNEGGYAAMAAAATDARIRAVVANSIYDKPMDMLRLQVRRSGLAGVPLVPTFCRWSFYLLNFSYRNDQALSERLPSLDGVAKLFVQARDNPSLAESTFQLFLAAPEPRQQTVVPKALLSAMSDEEKRSYEAELVGFLLQNLPPLPLLPPTSP